MAWLEAVMIKLLDWISPKAAVEWWNSLGEVSGALLTGYDLEW